MIGKKRREENKIEKLLVNENTDVSYKLKSKIKKEQPLFDELVGHLANAKITLSKPLKLASKGLYTFTPEQVLDYIKKVKKYYIDNSGLTADWLSSREKLETIKKAETVDRVTELFTLIKYPLFHLNEQLFELYVEEFVFSYVYHPNAIQMTKDVRTALSLLRDKLKVGLVESRLILKNYIFSSISDELVNTAIESMAGVRMDDELHSTNQRYRA